MKNIKNQKGSVTLFVVITVLFFVIITIAVYVSNSNTRVSQMQEIERIKEIYEADLANIDKIYEERANGEIEVEPEQKIYTFDYTGTSQEFTTPVTGYYKIEAWGAQGNNVASKRASGGLGAYTSGEIKLTEGYKLYIYVGEHRTDRLASFNCGSTGGNGLDGTNGGGENGYGGGGATDIRTVEGSSWSDFSSLKSRIMVAAGGGGASDYGYPANGGYGGGFTGASGNNGKYPTVGVANVPPTGGTQTSGGTTSKLSTGGGTGMSGSFGKGGNGNSSWGSAGGGGYYGGGGGGYTSNSVDSGAGGSSFISGHLGCNSISENSTETSITHTGGAEHYSGLVFTNTSMKNGNITMPTPEGSTSVGREGNGYVKITWVGEKPSESQELKYVSDSLLLQYDGIENVEGMHSNNTTTWKDISGNGRDILNLKGTIGQNYIELNGTQVMDVPLSGNFNDITIEIVMSNVGNINSTTFQLYGAYDRCISGHIPWQADSRIYFDASHDASGYQRINKIIDFNISDKHTMTFRKSTTLGQSIYLDGKLWVEDINLKRAVGNVTGAKLGGGYNTLGGTYWRGRIYSFRVYSKGLSQEEITHNYELDQERF